MQYKDLTLSVVIPARNEEGLIGKVIIDILEELDSELKKAVDEAIRTYNATPHEALNNVSPNDVYAGRKEEILQRRKEKKLLTLERRKKYNLEGNVNKNNDPDPYQAANLNNAKVSQKV